ncbi:lipid II:glycine glycyltransferase FemX [Ruegeria lacuscaerulensis]|uniref:lipid II:glycine glycyltransferase FemX n=1 Tax=Ruegeria lacuscaerulensis TaxID=55218 RepID=UPI0014805536|nr:peptidoglycan bridge formation glycyltransferase FemA/FemB family protein [Ruegeria lacuscaerulensis]
MTQPLTLQTVAAEDWPRISAYFRDLTYEQTLTYAQAAAQRIGAKAQFVTLSDQAGQSVAAACLRLKPVPGLGRGIAWIAAGPLVQPDTTSEKLEAVFAALRAYAQQSGHILRMRLPASALRDVPSVDQIAAAAGFVSTDRSSLYRTVIIDCDQDEDTLMRALHGKWRNPLRNALKSGMELETLPIAECADRFHSLYQQVQAAKGFSPDIPPEFYYHLNGPDFSHAVLFARQDGSDVGAMTIGRAGTNGVYLFGATSDAGRRLNAGHYLMWQAILHCKAHGLRWFDLGGIDAMTNPSVTRFKLRTGGTEVTAAGPYEFQPPGLTTALIRTAETVHTRMKARR